MIERSDGGARELHEHLQTWAIAPRVLAFLHGDASFESSGFMRIPEPPPPIDTLACDDAALAEIRSALGVPRSIVAVAGTPGLGRRTLLVAAAREAGLDVLELDAAKLATDTLRTQLRLAARECLLLGRVPLIANLDALAPDALAAVGTELVAHVPGTILATTTIDGPVLRWDRPTLVVELAPPTSAQRAQLWLASLGQGSVADGDILANQYPLAPALVVRAATAAVARAHGRAITPDDIQRSVRAVVDDKLGRFARRVRTTRRWRDMVLPADQAGAVVELIARFRERGRVYERWGFAAKVGTGLGIAALFSGPPGTGKSMCATLIAQELGLDLYQVDTSKISSKWIGETEKNLAALFDAAEASHAMLLFDECDGLFGKRTEQKSSNDRHANAETNYLLQRVESYRGICILTSNHAANIDPAFQRRLSLHVRFELPDAGERSAIWRAMFPPAAPLDGIDFASLARRYDMSGGYIKNAALRAAFLAANDGTSITQAHVERAARIEYEGMGKIAAFGEEGL